MSKTILRAAILACLAAAATACVTTPRERPHEGPVRLGQAAQTGGPIARPVKVVEDSRCPYNARCIQAGRAVVRTMVRAGGRWQQLDLTLGVPQPVADGRITLVSVTPERDAAHPAKPGDYRFAYEFAGGF